MCVCMYIYIRQARPERRKSFAGTPHTSQDAVPSCRPVELTFHEPVSREIRDGLAGTPQRTAVVRAKAPGFLFLKLGLARRERLQSFAGTSHTTVVIECEELRLSVESCN